MKNIYRKTKSFIFSYYHWYEWFKYIFISSCLIDQTFVTKLLATKQELMSRSMEIPD